MFQLFYNNLTQYSMINYRVIKDFKKPVYKKKVNNYNIFPFFLLKYIQNVEIKIVFNT